MATRSFIHVERTDGQWARIYCHSDGYYEHNGVLLQQYYNSQERAEALVSLGDISSLAPSIGVKHDFDFYGAFYDKYRNNMKEMRNDPEYQRLRSMCNVYGRDRGEKDVDAVVGASLEDVFADEEFMYVWKDGEWLAMSYTENLSKLRPLKDILAEENLPTEASAEEIAQALALEDPSSQPDAPHDDAVSSDDPTEVKPAWALA